MFILDANICTDVQLLNILTIVKIIIRILTIAVPIVLIIYVMIDIFKTVASSEVDTKKLFKTISKRIVGAVIIFLIPAFVRLGLSIIPNGKFIAFDCYEMAEKSEVARIAMENVNDSIDELAKTIGGTYDDAYLAYETARKDYKLIPKSAEYKEGKYCKTKQNCKEILDAYKIQVDAMK